MMEMLYRLDVDGIKLGARSSWAEATLSALKVGDLNEAEVIRGISGSLIKCGFFGFVVELLCVVVIQEKVEAKSVFNNREGMFDCEDWHSFVTQDEDSDSSATVNFVSQFWKSSYWLYSEKPDRMEVML